MKRKDKEKIVEALENNLQEKYKTKCAICGLSCITEKNTANEGICYSCRCY